jgi:predicted nucleotidyltransferase
MKQKNIKNKILYYYFINPTAKLRVREIERKLNIPIPSVIRYCKELLEEDYLTIIEIGNTKFYTSNKTNKKFILEKKFFNIKQLYYSGLIDFLKKELSNPNIILFGSYSKGEDIETSDIDLYIETKSKKNLNLEQFENYLNRKIQIFKYKNLKELNNPYLANNIINGINLNGFIEVF